MNGRRGVLRAILQQNTLVSPRFLVIILGLAGFISAADNWFVSPVLPAIASDFGISIPLAGMILTAYLIPYGLMQPVFGVISDHTGKIRVLLIILTGFAIGSGACAMAGSLPSLMIWRICTGFFAAGIIAVSLAHIGDTIPVAQRPQYVGIFMGIVFLGQGLSVGIGGMLTHFLSWRVAFLLFSLMAIIDILILRMIPDGRHCSPISLKDELLSIHDQRTWIFFALAGVTGFFLIGMYSYLGAFLHQIAGLDSMQTGFVIMFFGFSALIGGMKAGNIRRKLGYRRMIAGGAMIAMISGVILALFPRWETGLVASGGLGLGYICIQSTIATEVFDITPKSKGLPSALIGLGLFGGGGVGTYYMGNLITVCGYSESTILYSVGLGGILICSTMMDKAGNGA